MTAGRPLQVRRVPVTRLLGALAKRVPPYFLFPDLDSVRRVLEGRQFVRGETQSLHSRISAARTWPSTSHRKQFTKLVRDMKRTTPPRSSSSDEGGPPLPSGSRPKRRKRADSKGEDEAMGRPTRPGLDRRRVDNAENGFITLHEEFAELERTDFHFPNFRAFVDELNRTCQAKWKTRQVPYKRVSALLVRWEEDDLGVVKEIEMLHRIFHDTYHFDVENFTIPSGKRGYLGLIERIKSLLDIYDAEDNLFILYYAGHARQDGQSQPMWISSVIHSLSIRENLT